MHLSNGTILISTISLNNTFFERSIVFIVEYNEKGALGFVINKPFPRKLNELTEFKQSKALPLYEGGPVENDKLFFIHQRADLISNGVAVIDTIFWGGDFKQAITNINNDVFRTNDSKLFIGYCGWDQNELEQEIEEGSWQLCNIDPQIVFKTNVEMLWEEIHHDIKNKL
ncbi:YqgE/AlgH family protein [Ferruginibacter albus]|uniref:YqgE/AlgH family protein n=1 Tax=Ferruginibacter albus TaxID=2875540 RepID=UPI001CC42806|nr:YqgE/AlgH family protein [Ferruginibacter albus]UAY53448.1 YqgE/AlgH family protein [Ferruginibacter albus]